MREISLLILGAVLGFVGQWLFYRYQRRDERGQGPSIVVSKIQQGQHVLAELRNVGFDTLSEMDVKLSWLTNGQHHERLATDFFRTGETSPSRLEVLGANEVLTVSGLPAISDDGIIDVQVSGLGVTSQRLYSTVSQLAIALPPPQTQNKA